MKQAAVLEWWPTVESFAASAGEGPAEPLDGLPIRTDLREAISLCMRHLVSLFDADRGNEPFFYANRRADGTGEMLHSVHIGIPHVVGRCLLGGLAAEEATGMPFSAEGTAILEEFLRRSFDNEDHLNSYFDPKRGGARFVELHNMREGLYGLVCLARARGSSWAREKCSGMLQTLKGITDDQGRWSRDLAEARFLGSRLEGMTVSNAARMVDPLLECYLLTSDPNALALARAYARAGLEVIFEKDGTFSSSRERSSGHIHSITSSLSGITRLAIFERDVRTRAICKRILDKGVPQYFSSWGWGDEVYPDHPANEAGRGEINQTGDVIRTALALGVDGDPRYFELAERYLRSMLLPTQHRLPDLSRFLADAPEPRSDAERNVVHRSVGGYSMQLPNDRMREGDWPISTLDITSGAAHALAEAWRCRAVGGDAGFRVNLLFDYADDELAVRSHLPLRGLIELTVRRDAEVSVRIPPWVDPGSVRVVTNEGILSAAVEEGYARVPNLSAGQTVRLQFPVPCRRERETVDGTEYRTTWIGNQIIRILPRGSVSPLPF